MITIYNADGEQIIEVEVDDNSYRHRVIMGDYNLTLYYSLAEHVELPVGCYCEYQGERFELARPEAFKMKHSRQFEYTVTMESPQTKSKIWKFRNPVDGRLKFSLTAKPHEHLQMFIDNMNSRDSGWAVGECISGAEVCISYDHAYCYDALSQMASELETEFEFNGKTVSLHKVEYNKDNPLPLSYGRGNGFAPNLGRSNYGDNPPTEILYVQGGSDNIDASKYGSSELLLPKSQQIAFDGTYFEDQKGYDADKARHYTTDEKGYSIRRTDKEFTSQAEDSLDCSEIYPKRVGTISSVEIVDADKNYYDIVDNSIPDNLDYEKYLIDGETMTIIFQTGMLAGKEFEVKYYHKSILNPDGTLRKKAHRFEITPQEIDGETMPNETYAPRVGEQYAVFNCTLPDEYICDNDTKSGASWDMFREGVKSLYDNEETKFTFTGELDGIWAKKDWVNIGGRIKLGGYVNFTDERFQKESVLIRITGIKDYVNKPYSPTIELSNETVGSSFTTTMTEIKSTEVVIEDTKKNVVQFTKRRFRDAQETIAMLEASMLDNFTKSISPIAVQTMQMLVGDDSLQFRFVTSKTNPQQTTHSITYDAYTKVLKADAGIIQHMTLGVSSLSSAHKASEYLYWDMTAYESAVLDDSTKKYYLYAKVSKTDGTGEFLLSETAKTINSIDGFYCLLVGVLNSEYNNDRSFATLYGYTEILPGRITTDKIVSTDGGSWLDLSTGAMQLGEKLKYQDNVLDLDFLLSDGANLGGWIFRNNRLESQDSKIFLDGVNGEVRLQGTLQLSTGYDGTITDTNIFYLPAIKEGTTILKLTCTEKDIGKVVRLFNGSKYGGGRYKVEMAAFNIHYGGALISIDEYATFYATIDPQETLEITCFETSVTQPEDGTKEIGAVWEVTSRFGFEQFEKSDATGRFARLLAQGSLNGSTYQLTGKFFDGRDIGNVLTVAHSATETTITFSAEDIPNGYWIMVSSRGYRLQKSSVLYPKATYASVYNVQDTSFNIRCVSEPVSDSSSYTRLDDTIIDFMIFASNWEYNKQ